MCQYKETRCFTSTKPKTVYKVVIQHTSVTAPFIRFEAFFESFTYSNLGELNNQEEIRYGGEQTGYHCFLTIEDAKRFLDLHKTLKHKYVIVKCTIPANESYRYGVFHMAEREIVKTLRATNIIIDSVL
jgi:hypothetical protein